MDKKNKTYSLFSFIVLIGAILIFIIWSIANFLIIYAPGSVKMSDTIISFVFELIAISLATFIFGLIPYLLFSKKIDHPKIVVFGIVFIIFACTYLLIMFLLSLSPANYL